MHVDVTSPVPASFEDRLIELIKAQPSIWDSNNTTDTKMLNRDHWSRISAALGVDVPICKRKWKSLRTAFRKSFQKSQRNSSHNKWHRFEQMSFLSDVIADAVHNSFSKTSSEEEQDQAADSDNDTLYSLAESSHNKAASSSKLNGVLERKHSLVKSSKRKSSGSMILHDRKKKGKKNTLTTVSKQRETSHDELNDEDILFGRSVGLTLQQYPLTVKNHIKCRVMQLFMEIDEIIASASANESD